jgi:hypothetical protein
MRDLNGRVDRLEKRIGAAQDDGLIVLTIPYDVDPNIAQKRALEEKGYTERDISGCEVVFITSYVRT